MHAVFSTLTCGLERFIWIKSCCGYGHSSKLKSLRSVRRKVKGMKKGISIVSFTIARDLGALLEDMFFRV